MNDKDKEAFEKWFNALDDKHLNRVIKLNRGASQEAWQAACEYKKTQELKGSKMKQMNDRIEELLAENKKLREALKFYANKYSWTGTHIGPSDYWFDDKQGYYFGGLRAREALKEAGEL